MQFPHPPHDLLGLAFGRPTVGDLGRLCEENFVLLCRLAPGLPVPDLKRPDRKPQRQVQVSRRKGSVDLFLRIEEQSRYTSVITLTHYFAAPAWGHEPGADEGPTPRPAPDGGPAGPRADPDARLRIYHDARQVEVIDLRQSALPLRADYQRPALAAKWRVNLFLGKWLAYCLHQGHRFGPGGAAQPLPEDGDLIDVLT